MNNFQRSNFGKKGDLSIKAKHSKFLSKQSRFVKKKHLGEIMTKLILEGRSLLVTSQLILLESQKHVLMMSFNVSFVTSAAITIPRAVPMARPSCT